MGRGTTSSTTLAPLAYAKRLISHRNTVGRSPRSSVRQRIGGIDFLVYQSFIRFSSSLMSCHFCLQFRSTYYLYL